MRPQEILCRYGELALKGQYTRRWFEKRLLSNIRSGLKGSDFKIRKEDGRIFIKTKEIEKSCKVLKRIFGLTSVSPVVSVTIKADLEKIVNNAEKFARNFIKKEDTFAVRGRRTGNDAFTSQMIERRVGARIVEKIGSKVNLTNPDKTLYIEVRQNKAYFFKEKIICPGGLPLGTQGKVIILLSGGIDSAVSAWLIMKRGCSLTLLYFDNSPYSDNAKRVKEVVKALKKWSIGSKLTLKKVKNGNNLKEILKNCRSNLTCVLCKRMMYRLANEVAKKFGAKAIATGENLGQVASQTLDNLYVLDHASDLPVLRPIIGLNKEEIVKIAKEIGTYEPSILPSGPCKAVPDSPRTKARLNEVLKEEEKLDIENLIKRSLKTIKVF